MIKSDLFKSKLYDNYKEAFVTDPSRLKHLARSAIKILRKSSVNGPTKRVYFSKVVNSEISGVDFLNVKFDSMRSMFGSMRQTIKSKKRKRNKGLNFILWSNYFSFLLNKMKYLILVAVQNPDFLQRAFKKYRFDGSSYLYMSYGVIRGLYSFIKDFGEFSLERGTILFYSPNFSDFIQLLNFLYSDSFYTDFIVLKIKMNDVYVKDVRFLFFFKSLGLNTVAIISILNTFFVNYVRNFKKVLFFLYEIVSSAIVSNFFPLRFFLLKYVNVYTGWKRLS